jgi:hypothetical protein
MLSCKSTTKLKETKQSAKHFYLSLWTKGGDYRDHLRKPMYVGISTKETTHYLVTVVHSLLEELDHDTARNCCSVKADGKSLPLISELNVGRSHTDYHFETDDTVKRDVLTTNPLFRSVSDHRCD